MTTKTVPITENHEIKTPLTPEKKDELLKQISEAYKEIYIMDMAIGSHQDAVKSLKKQIDDKQLVVKGIISVYDRGYESRIAECVITYENGEITFTEKSTGAIVEQRAITEEEQLRLANGWIDAESVIRADNEEKESGDEE